MNPNLREVVLPGGGRANVRLRLTHEQDTVLEAATLDYWDALPDDVLASIQDRESASTDDVKKVAKRTRGYGAVTRATDAMMTAQILACVADWDGVRDPDGNDLAWPAGLSGLASADFAALHEGCLAAVAAGRADPNAGAGPSEKPSTPEDPTPDGPQPSAKPGG